MMDDGGSRAGALAQGLTALLYVGRQGGQTLHLDSH